MFDPWKGAIQFHHIEFIETFCYLEQILFIAKIFLGPNVLLNGSLIPKNGNIRSFINSNFNMQSNLHYRCTTPKHLLHHSVETNSPTPNFDSLEIDLWNELQHRILKPYLL